MLAIVRRLVEMHGGSVEAKSAGTNLGSEFVVHLPASVAQPAPPAAAASELPPMRREVTPDHRRILVVDDNVDLADSLAMMLRMLGHDVKIAYDGFAAVDASAQFAPDLIFLDIGMPGMNGYDTCRKIRAGAHGQEAVVVALSGWGQDHDKQRSREAGMDMHLVKPFDPALLESMLDKIGGRDAGGAAVDEQLGGASIEAEAEAEAELASSQSPRCETEPVSPAGDELRVEAARYALFRRILPVLRHGLVGELQSVSFAVNVARHACERSGAAPETLGAIARIGEQAHAAAGRGQSITDWLRPDPRATTTVGDAVHACLGLVGAEWSLRAIEVAAKVPAASLRVRAAAFREVLAAMLLALGDGLPGAADIILTARSRDGDIVVSLRARAAPRDGDCGRVALYRDLRWDDVAALARAHGVSLARRGNHALLRFPALAS